MCIRDRGSILIVAGGFADQRVFFPHFARQIIPMLELPGLSKSCLLYTSDAADERSSVDLGGRRIIKKKTTVHKKSRSYIQELQHSDDKQD